MKKKFFAPALVLLFVLSAFVLPKAKAQTQSPLMVTKNVINLTSKNLNWQSSMPAMPGDTLSFAIILQAGNQDVHNVVVKDTLPPNLIYKGNLTLNTTANSADDPTSANGIAIGTIPANGMQVVSYQVQVAPASAFGGQLATLTNNATITSAEGGSQSASTSITVNAPDQQQNVPGGPTSYPTGLTNDIFKDSFFLPAILIVLFSWLYFSGRIYKLADWMENKF